jgi:deoxyribodipyrimidine photo-lyase
MKSTGRGFTPFDAANRIRAANDRAIRRDGDYVLYWMIAARRPSHNFALDRAVTWSRELGKPLIVLEALRVDYPWASDRLHRFVIDGMAANAAAFARCPVTYYPYVEPASGAGKGLVQRLGRKAAVVVTDDFPCFFLPDAVAAAAVRIDVRLEAVDSNGILPIRSAGKAFTAAVHFRRHVQTHLREHIRTWPAAKPFEGVRLPAPVDLSADIQARWPAARRSLLQGDSDALAALPIDHEVSVTMRGGHPAARRRMKSFVRNGLDRYHETRDHPDDEGTSRLSPYLHFGHLSAHEVFDAVMTHEKWSVGRLPARASGRREGWWKVRPGAEAFLEQLIVWRELAYNGCAAMPDGCARFETLPAWARETLEEHAADEREHVYTREQLEGAGTDDQVWNAAQMQLRREGWFHNYMRMLWAKKILEWSATPQDALQHMIAIMNRWSLDGRDPNAYAGYMWALGRYDRPWPERPVYGKVRSMSSARTRQKVRVKRYLSEFTGEAPRSGRSRASAPRRS